MAERIPITSDQIAAALDFRKRGRTLTEAAKALNLSRRALSTRVTQHDRKVAGKLQDRKVSETVKTLERLEWLYSVAAAQLVNLDPALDPAWHRQALAALKDVRELLNIGGDDTAPQRIEIVRRIGGKRPATPNTLTDIEVTLDDEPAADKTATRLNHDLI